MRRFIIRRLFQAVLMLLLLSFLLFLMIHALPGGPERVFFSPHETAADRQHITQEFGVDKPLPIQYLISLGAALHFALGRSFFSNQTVSSAVAERIPPTIELFLVALTFALLIAILLGVFSA